VTLSRGQQAACQRHGLEVHLRDARTVTRETYGPFDGVVSLGAFEHFCSIDEYKAGRQDAIYSSLFENVATMIPKGGRFFLQTMVFGKHMIPLDRIRLDAPRLSDAHVLALLQKTFPGSWLPYGSEQVEQNAASHFKLVKKESGRLDYIETIRIWRSGLERSRRGSCCSGPHWYRSTSRAAISGTRSCRASARTPSHSSGSSSITTGLCSSACRRSRRSRKSQRSRSLTMHCVRP
jgi:cyclopropane fatty-acyl-phospholipid synthase-like methyltransferase